MNIIMIFFGSLCDFFISLFLFFFPLNKNRLIFNSTGNKNYNFNSKFLFEFMTQSQRSEGIKCFFVVNDLAKRKELISSGIDNIISSTSLKDKILIYLSKTWVCSTIETPVSSILKHPSRVVYHLGHGIPLKNIGMAEVKIPFIKKINRILKLRAFTHVTCYSEYFKDVLYKAFNKDNSINYIQLGQPRNDYVLSKGGGDILKHYVSMLRNDTFHNARKILYCPTWRNYAVSNFFPFSDFDKNKLNDFLEKHNLILYTREHPYYKFNYPEGIDDIPRVVKLNSDILPDITSFLSLFDILITDYSSIFLDFYLTGNPVVFIPYDFEEYELHVGFSKPYNEIAVGEHVYNFKEFMQCLCKDYDLLKRVDDKYIHNLNIKSSGNCEEHYQMIVKLTHGN